VTFTAKLIFLAQKNPRTELYALSGIVLSYKSELIRKVEYNICEDKKISEF
jgi:hypothetical protein